MIGWALETIIATTLLMLLVLALRAPVRKAFGPAMAYTLWLLPVLRMLMPPLPGDWGLTRLFAPLTQSVADAPPIVAGVLNPATLPPEVARHAVTTIELGGHDAAVALVPPTVATDGAPITMLVLGLWGIGALLFLAYHLISHSRYCRNLLRAARIDGTVAQGKVRVIETDAAHGPLAFGVFPQICRVPARFFGAL